MYYYLYLAFALLRNSILRNAKFCILTCDENRSKHSRMCLKQESWNHFQGFRIQIHRLHGLVTKPFCLKINFKLRIKPKYCNFDYPTGQQSSMCYLILIIFKKKLAYLMMYDLCVFLEVVLLITTRYSISRRMTPINHENVRTGFGLLLF